MTYLSQDLISLRERILLILNELTSGTQLFPVDVTAGKSHIEVFMDGDNGINLKDCADINRKLHEKLQAEGIDTDELIIDVSSPGVERPIEGYRDWKKNVGRKIQIRNAQGKFVKGSLCYLDPEKIVLRIGGGFTVKFETLNFQQIKEAKVVI